MRLFRPSRSVASPASSEPPASERDREKYFFDFLKAEYDSLRAESAQARLAQQQILQWSLAAIAAIFAASLIFAGGGADRVEAGFSGTLFLVVYLGVLPGLVVTACWAWIGELVRMERVGYYLRGIEVEVCAGKYGQADFRHGPLRWESYLALGQKRSTGKQLIGYLGAGALYFGSLSLANIIGLAAIAIHRFDLSTWIHTRALLTTIPIAWWILFLTSTLSVARSLVQVSKVGYDMAGLEPVTTSSKPV